MDKIIAKSWTLFYEKLTTKLPILINKCELVDFNEAQ